MEHIATASRIHPLFAAAAVSVIAVSATGIAALTGALPSSKAESLAQANPMGLSAQQTIGARQAFDAQQLAAAQQPALMAEPAPVVRQAAAQPERVIVREKIVYREAAPRKTVRKEPARSYAARHQEPVYAPAPVVQERKPNYVAIGTGAVVGGLIGNQIGGGNGKKLATLAGVIGGGYIGNEIANRNK